MHPIGVGEVIRRLIGKCVSKIGKQDVIDASGATQVCAGHKSGSEAAIHAMHDIFESDETDAALLFDASNAFNSLNRAAALHNVRVICPIIAIYAINTFRAPATFHYWRKRAQFFRRSYVRGPISYELIRNQPPTTDNTLERS